MTFAYPFLLWLVLGSFLTGAAVFIWQKRRKRLSAISIPFLEDLKAAQRQAGLFSIPKMFLWGKWLFFALAVLLLSLALARPQTVSEESKVSKNGVDILIALDVSESMMAEDLKPNRIEAAKKYIEGFIAQLQNDRAGLEVFAGKPFTQSPLSFDYNVLRYYISEISTATIDQRYRGLNGTAIGDAIVAAIDRFENTPDRTKVLILLTDGEANVGVDPILAAEHARSKGIKIYTIGIGDKNGAPLPIGQANGQTQYARNPDGSLVKTEFDEEALKNIAQIAGGEYFYAGNNEALQKSFESINALEKTEYKAEYSVKKEDHFWKFLIWGFLFALASSGILFGEPLLRPKAARLIPVH